MEKQPICDCDVIHQEIVDTVRPKMLNAENVDKLSNLYKMFADNTRIKILWALDCSEMCVCDMAVLLGMTKSAISHQLKPLRLLNLIKYRKEGRNVYYSLADDHVKDILDRGLEHINE